MDHKSDLNYKCALLTLVVMLFAITETASGQTTAFSYQGRLTDAGNPANGNYDIQLKRFDTSTVRTVTPQDATLTRNPAAVSAGIFTIQFIFGALVFENKEVRL